jgi:ribosome biogenesis GTPase
LPKGIIIKGIGGFYYVETATGLYECKARGVFRKKKIIPLPGDSVSISVTDEKSKQGFIEEIFERRTCLTRPAVANINQVIAVASIKSPEPDYLLLDKLLITAAKQGIDAVICFNKTDLGTEEEIEEAVEVFKNTGYTVILTSINSSESYGKLKAVLKDRISVLAGQSGVGKSTILNGIVESNVMETGAVSKKIDRGRHTTRHAELIPLGGGYIVDTPGFSSFELEGFDEKSLQSYYPEFAEYTVNCRFNGCSHISEPGCCVKEALREGLISKIRYDNYVNLYTKIKQLRDIYPKKRKEVLLDD